MAAPDYMGGTRLTAAEVLAYAQRVSRNRVDVGVNLCQRFVRMAFGSAGGAPTAVAAWQAAQYKHKGGTPPPGAAVYWGGGAGHVAISAGNGMVYSTDVKEPGKVDLVPISFITQRWGKPLLGWSDDNNGIRITEWNAKSVEGQGAGPIDYSSPEGGAGGGVAKTYSKKELAERYGFAAEFFERSPELQKLLAQAVREQWEPDEFEARLRNSKWYRKHTEEERAWAVRVTGDPASAEKDIADMQRTVVRMFKQMGVPMDGKRAEQIARSAVIHGWDEARIQASIAKEFDYKPKDSYGGVAGQTIDTLTQMASSYVVPLSRKTVEQWTEAVLRGDSTPDDFESYLKDMAKSQWDDPQLKAAIDRGVTTDQYLAPWREMAASELEISPEDINWMGNPKWSQAIYQTDPKTGERRFKSLADWQRELRTNDVYGYDKTTGARDTAARFATELNQMFGVMG